MAIQIRFIAFAKSLIVRVSIMTRLMQIQIGRKWITVFLSGCWNIFELLVTIANDKNGIPGYESTTAQDVIHGIKKFRGSYVAEALL